MPEGASAGLRFFAGWYGAVQAPLRPADSLPCREIGQGLWTVGDWMDHEVRVVRYGQARAVILGCCLASENELRREVSTVVDGRCPWRLSSLPGSFAAVLYYDNRLDIVTDLAGLHPVFWVEHADGVAFCSLSVPLAALTGGEVDTEWLAGHLMCPDLPEVQGDRSVFYGVHRAGPAAVLTLDGRRRTLRQYPPASVGSTLAEGAARLREGLSVAVQGRMATAARPSVDLSGGLDSSTLALLAATHRPNVLAITYADRYAVNDDDVGYARRLAEGEPRLRHHMVSGGEDCLPFTGISTAPFTDEPSLDVIIAARTLRRLMPVIDEQGDMHLGGDGGDVVLAGPISYLGDLARARRFGRLAREAAGWARLRHRPVHAVFQAAIRLAATSYARTLAGMAKPLDVPADRDGAVVPALEDQLVWAGLAPAAAWATPSARRVIADRLYRAADLTTSAVGGGDGAAWRAVCWHGGATRTFIQVARDFGVACHTPFLDNQVIRACTAVPAAERTSALRAKPLLRAALAGVVPASQLERRTKGDYTACEYHGLNRHADELRSLLAAPVLADYDLIDPAHARRALDLALSGVRAPLGALGAVLASEVWLRALPTHTRRTWWTRQPIRTEESDDCLRRS